MAVGTSARRYSEWMCLAVVLGPWCVPPCAEAQESPGVARPPMVLEAHGGWNGPLGVAGVDLVYDPGRRFSGGVGLGVGPTTCGLFGRLRVFRAGPFSLGLAATMSVAEYLTERTYNSPPGNSMNRLRWKWSPGYRATGAAATELTGRRWSLRVEAGVAYLLNEPTCSYWDHTSSYEGGCNSPLIPAPYRFSVQPGRVIPSITASIGYRFGVKDAVAQKVLPVTDRTPAAVNALYRSPGKALALSLGLSLPSAVIGSLLLAGHEVVGGFVVLALGLGVGPSLGHLYADEPAHAWLTMAGRLTGFSVGGFLVLSAWASRMVEYPRTSKSDAWLQAGFGLAFVAGALALGIYDIVDAPRAARRSNARNGVTNLSLAPVVAPGGPAPSRGLAVQGRF